MPVFAKIEDFQGEDQDTFIFKSTSRMLDASSPKITDGEPEFSSGGGQSSGLLLPAVQKVIPDLDEKPFDPLEDISTNYTEVEWT